MRIYVSTGIKETARGFMNPNTGEIGAQYDNALVEQEDIVKHEVMEKKLAYGEVNADDVIELAARYVDMAKIEAMIDFYDRYIPSENKEHAKNEVVCDGADHINQVRHLGAAYAELADTFDEVLNALNRAANELTDGAFELDEDGGSQVSVKENRAATDGETRFSTELSLDERKIIAENFKRDISEWDSNGRPSGERFVLSYTGDVLQGLGAIESDIYMNGDKIYSEDEPESILRKHPEMTINEIKRMPLSCNISIICLVESTWSSSVCLQRMSNSANNLIICSFVRAIVRSFFPHLFFTVILSSPFY